MDWRTPWNGKFRGKNGAEETEVYGVNDEPFPHARPINAEQVTLTPDMSICLYTAFFHGVGNFFVNIGKSQ